MIKEYKKNIKKCPNCSTVWIFDNNDVQSKEVYDNFAGNYTEHFIRCPKCNNHLEVYKRNEVWR